LVDHGLLTLLRFLFCRFVGYQSGGYGGGGGGYGGESGRAKIFVEIIT
jgi:hypothetical protein